jgi:hypothetical protein
MFALCVVVPIRRQITVSEFRDALGGLVSGLTHEELKLLAAHFDMDGERRSALFSETCPAPSPVVLFAADGKISYPEFVKMME